MRVEYITGLATGGHLSDDHRRALAEVLDLLTVAKLENIVPSKDEQTARMKLHAIATHWAAVKVITTGHFVCGPNGSSRVRAR